MLMAMDDDRWAPSHQPSTIAISNQPSAIDRARAVSA
jgi:hypothetical protein